MASAKFAMNGEAWEKILSELRCNSCKNDLTAYEHRKNVYVCVEFGHSLCENCKDECSCGSKVTKAPSKAISNLLQREPLQNLANYCRFFQRGCRELLPAVVGEIEKHEKCCIFRSITCPTYYCKELISFRFLEQHLAPNHGLVLACRKSENSDIFLMYPNITAENYDDESTSRPRKLITSQNEIFFVSGILRNEMMHLWVQFYGSPEEAKNYEFSMSSKTNTSNMNTYYGPVYPIDEDKKVFWNKGETLAIPTRFMLGMIEKYGEFPIEIEIKCLKDEAKNLESGLYHVSE